MLSPWVQFVPIKLAAVEQWNFLIKLSHSVIGMDIFASQSSLLKMHLWYGTSAQQSKHNAKCCFSDMFKSVFFFFFLNESTN